MFNKWLKDNRVMEFDLSCPLFPTADDRDFWDARADGRYIKDAEEYLGFEWPSIRAREHMAYFTEGDRRAMEVPHFTRRNALCKLLLGEIAEYRGRFIPDIVDGVFAICEESFWGVSAHSVCRNIPDGDKSVRCIDLFAAETGSLIAMTCYMLKDELEKYCPEIVTRAKWELYRRIIEPYATRTDFFWMGYGYPVNNWNAWILSNVLTVYLLLEKDKWKLSCAVTKMMIEINRLYETYPEDGGCDEGACYWAVSGGCIFEFCDLLYVASGGRLNFFDDEKLRRIGRFILRNYIGNGYIINFADGMAKINHAMTGLLWMMGLRTGEPEYFALAREQSMHDPEKEGMTPFVERDAKIKRRLYEMIYEEEIKNAPTFVPAESDIFEVLQVASVRGDGWTVAAKGGHNGENHNHNDVGSFLAYFDNSPVLVDPSCGTYVGASFRGNRYGIWTNRSDWHNLPVINGVIQKEGKNYRADGFSLDKNTINISFAGAYPDDAGTESVSRSITTEGGTVRLTDSITLRSKGNVTENFITPLPVTVNGDRAVINGRFILACDKPCRITSDSVPFEGDERLTLLWKTEDMKRISFTFDDVTEVSATFTLRKL